MLLFAGMLTFAVAGMQSTPDRARWRATGAILVLFGIEESLGLHTWADRHLSVEQTSPTCRSSQSPPQYGLPRSV